MDNWAVNIAKEFKKRDNESFLGFIVGTVVAENPLKISGLNGQIFIDKGYKLENASFEVGDSVILISSGNNQSFFIAGKCEKFGE